MSLSKDCIVHKGRGSQEVVRLRSGKVLDIRYGTASAFPAEWIAGLAWMTKSFHQDENDSLIEIRNRTSMALTEWRQCGYLFSCRWLL